MLAEFESGVRLPSKLLSIGERVMAGLALRIALAQIWQESPSTGGSEQPTTPGFFILDEPTEYLDEANVRTLAKTLAGLEALGQILIVTHDRDLMEEIGEASQVHSIVLPSPG
jgi:DNA repair exonuclease SbcCD ATPase subunit